MVECSLSITHCLRLNLQLHTIDLVRTCRIRSFGTVAWQLARFQQTRRIARSLGDTELFVRFCSVVCYCGSGKGHSSSPDPTPSPPTASRLSRLRRSTCDPPCSSGVDAHVEDQRQTDRVTYTLTRTGLRRCRGPRRATPHASPR